MVLSSDVLLDLMTQSWWYELLIPPGYLDFRFDRLILYQDIATHLLRGYLDRFYMFQKREFGKPFLEYQVLEAGDDDLIRKSYQLLVKKSEKQLIQRLKQLSEKFAGGEFEAFSFANLQIFQAERHLYQPLIHLTHDTGQDSLVKVIPTPKACRYDPDLNPTYQEMAMHYGVGVVPARPYKPRDKAYASYCTSCEPCTTFCGKRRRLASLTPCALRGGLGPGSSYSQSLRSLNG